jgi:hypothetical protein
VEPLDQVAAHLGQPALGLGILHALGDHPQAEAVAEGHGGLDDGGVTGVGGHPEHEALVDLHLVDRQLAQIAEGGVADAEVVHRQVDAEVAELREHADGPLRVDHDLVLGDLQRERAGRQPRRDQQAGHVLDQPRRQQAARGQVDRHAEVQADRPPATAGLEGVDKHQPAQRCDQPGVLGDRDEHVRRHHAAGGVQPACQRLGAHDPAGGDLHLRLVGDGQGAGVDRRPQLPDERQPVGVGRVAGLGVDLDPGVPGLGEVHGHVGPLE